MNAETIRELLQSAQVGVSVLTAAATALLGFLFYNSSLTNRSTFTQAFLKVLSFISVLKAVEVFSAAYRSWRVEAAAVPLDAVIVGLCRTDA